MSLDFCDQKKLCVANTLYKKKNKRKVTSSSGGNDIEILCSGWKGKEKVSS